MVMQLIPPSSLSAIGRLILNPVKMISLIYLPLYFSNPNCGPVFPKVVSSFFLAQAQPLHVLVPPHLFPFPDA